MTGSSLCAPRRPLFTLCLIRGVENESKPMALKWRHHSLQTRSAPGACHNPAPALVGFRSIRLSGEREQRLETPIPQIETTPYQRPE